MTSPASPVTPASTPPPIGIFDSGVGGLSILRAIRAHLPAEPLVYCADSRYAPYGERDQAFVLERAIAICDWMLAQGTKIIVVACNTATVQTIHGLRERLAIPLVGVEPGVKPAALTSVSRVAGVLATAGTLRSDKFRNLLASHAGDCRFILQAGHGLVEAIERGETDSPAVEALLRTYLTPMLDAGADTLVLGCTHYPFLDRAIRRVTAERLALLDTGMAVARQLERLLTLHGTAAPADARPGLRLVTTADSAGLASAAHALLALDAQVETVTIGATVDALRPVESAQPADTVRPVDPAQPASAARSTDTANPADTAGAADTAGPADPAVQATAS